jgi:hypothetical protein
LSGCVTIAVFSLPCSIGPLSIVVERSCGIWRCNRRQAILNPGEERIHVQPAGSKEMARPIIACDRLTPSLKCEKKNQHVPKRKETAVGDIEMEVEKQGE